MQYYVFLVSNYDGLKRIFIQIKSKIMTYSRAHKIIILLKFKPKTVNSLFGLKKLIPNRTIKNEFNVKKQ